MSDERSSPPQTSVKSYSQGIQARAAERQEQRRQEPVFPNLASAAVTYQAGRDGPKTLSELAAEQRHDGERPPEAPSLSAATVEGLKALHAAEAAARGAAPARQEPQAAPAPAAPSQPDYDDVDQDPDDAAFANALSGVRKQVVESERERLAVAKRVKEIDISEGLLTGEFTQSVPVVPGKLNVKFRTLSHGENHELRLMLYEATNADARLNNMASEILGFYQTAAMLMGLNDTAFAKHMVSNPTGQLVFSREVFTRKLEQLKNYPMSLIALLGQHATWFDQRVRDLFTTADHLKNG